MENEVENIDKSQGNGVLPCVTNRTFKCNRCGTIYTSIDGDVIGCCVMPVEHRTSGICGGELIEVVDILSF